MTRFQCSRIAVDNDHFGFLVGATSTILYRNRDIYRSSYKDICLERKKKNVIHS